MTSQKNIVYLGWVVVAVVVGYAFTLIGSPETNRKRMEDGVVVDILNRLDCGIRHSYQQNGIVPKTLNDMQSSFDELRSDSKCKWCALPRQEDFEDVVQRDVQYTPSKNGYKICAAFHFAIDPALQKKKYYYENSRVFDDYQQGINCFERELRMCK